MRPNQRHVGEDPLGVLSPAPLFPDTSPMTSNKRTYETPELSVEGKVKDLTLGDKSGAKLDATFPAGTPAGQLTFS